MGSATIAAIPAPSPTVPIPLNLLSIPATFPPSAAIPEKVCNIWGP